MEVTARIVRLHLAETFVISRESAEFADVVQVSIRHADAIGHGEGAPIERYGESAASAAEFVEEHGHLVGDDPFALEEIGARLAEIPGEQAAKSALDAALHDLQGKLLGVPVWRLLGLPRTGPPTSWTVWLGDPDDMARRAEKAAPRFRRLKLKLGGGVVLRERSPVAIYVDEDCHTLDDVAACTEIAHGVNIKLAKSGGIREALRMTHAARALGLGVMLGCMIESGLGIAAACAVGPLCDHVDLDGNLLLAHDPWEGPALIDGVQVPADEPGLGVHETAAHTR